MAAERPDFALRVQRDVTADTTRAANATDRDARLTAVCLHEGQIHPGVATTATDRLRQDAVSIGTVSADVALVNDIGVATVPAIARCTAHRQAEAQVLVGLGAGRVIRTGRFAAEQPLDLAEELAAGARRRRAGARIGHRDVEVRIAAAATDGLRQDAVAASANRQDVAMVLNPRGLAIAGRAAGATNDKLGREAVGIVVGFSGPGVTQVEVHAGIATATPDAAGFNAVRVSATGKDGACRSERIAAEDRDRARRATPGTRATHAHADRRALTGDDRGDVHATDATPTANALRHDAAGVITRGDDLAGLRHADVTGRGALASIAAYARDDRHIGLATGVFRISTVKLSADVERTVAAAAADTLRHEAVGVTACCGDRADLSDRDIAARRTGPTKAADADVHGREALFFGPHQAARDVQATIAAATPNALGHEARAGALFIRVRAQHVDVGRDMDLHLLAKACIRAEATDAHQQRRVRADRTGDVGAAVATATTDALRQQARTTAPGRGDVFAAGDLHLHSAGVAARTAKSAHAHDDAIGIRTGTKGG